MNSLPKTVNLNSGAVARDGAKADRRWTLQPLKVPNISQCFSKVCEIFNGIVKSINPAVFKLGSTDQRGSAMGSHGVRERIPKSSNCLHGF